MLNNNLKLNAMKNTNAFLLIILLIFLSCSNEDEEVLISLQDTASICDGTIVDDPNFSGTACCIQRNSILDLNRIVEYEHTTNLTNTVYEWKVDYGEIEVITAMNSNIIRFKFKENFTSARLLASCSGDLGGCTIDVIITATYE
jgi:hypothetical protein